MSLVPLDCPCSCIVLVTEINNRRHLPGSEHSVQMTDSDSNTGSFLSSQRWISRLFQNWWRKQCQAQENSLGEHIMPSLMPTQETPGTLKTPCGPLAMARRMNGFLGSHLGSALHGLVFHYYNNIDWYSSS